MKKSKIHLLTSVGKRGRQVTARLRHNGTENTGFFCFFLFFFLKEEKERERVGEGEEGYENKNQ